MSFESKLHSQFQQIHKTIHPTHFHSRHFLQKYPFIYLVHNLIFSVNTNKFLIHSNDAFAKFSPNESDIRYFRDIRDLFYLSLSLVHSFIAAEQIRIECNLRLSYFCFLAAHWTPGPRSAIFWCEWELYRKCLADERSSGETSFDFLSSRMNDIGMLNLPEPRKSAIFSIILPTNGSDGGDGSDT